MNVAELKQQLQAVMQLPDETPLCSGTAYAAALASRKALETAIAAIWEGVKGDEREAIRQISLAGNREARRRRRPGRTGSFDTPAETWETMRAASLAGESLRSLGERFRVIYYAVQRRRRQDLERGVQWGGELRRREDRAPSNVIHFPRAVRS